MHGTMTITEDYVQMVRDRIEQEDEGLAELVAMELAEITRLTEMHADGSIDAGTLDECLTDLSDDVMRAMMGLMN